MSDILRLKTAMLDYFERPQINRQILQYIEGRNIKYQDLDNEQLIEMLDELDLLEPITDQLQLQEEQQQQYQRGINEQPSNGPMDMFQIESNRKTFKIKIEKGRNFDFSSSQSEKDKFFISICGLQQRGRTNSYPISIAKNQFQLDQTITFKVNPNLLKLTNQGPIELAVIIIHKNGQKSIFSIKNIEWRYVLSYGSANFDIELAPYHHEGTKQLPCAGILSIKLILSSTSKINSTPQRSLNHQFQLQKKNRELNNNRFHQYANHFWNDFKSIHRNFQIRRVKFYADSEDKILIPLCRFVHPLYNMRGIDSSHHALRFCSLIPFEQPSLNRKPVHKRFHTVLAGNQGSVDDHCHLLCSLLLGLGLKAYVCLGHSVNGQHSWVLTVQKNAITFWQSTKGLKHDFYSPKTYNFYKSIHVVYNHNEYYANTQLEDLVSATKFDFSDSTCWKKMDTAFLKPLENYNTQISLQKPSFDASNIQSDIQFNVCKQIAGFRKINKLHFDHDSILASILSTALANFQIERVTGQTFCYQEFQSAVKSYVPLKHTFKAFPIQLTTLDPKEIIEILKNNAKCREIMLSRGDSLVFAIKAKLILFPENVFALWLSIAVKYYKAS